MNTMQCKEFDAALPAFGLDPDDDLALMDHAATCDGCQLALDAFVAEEARLKAALSAPVPSSLKADLKAGLVQTPATHRGWWPWLAAAAAIVLAFGLWSRTGQGGAQAVRAEGQTTLASAGTRKDLGEAQLKRGDHLIVSEGSSTLVKLAGSQVWLGAQSEVEVLATERGHGPVLRLQRGTAHWVAEPGQLIEIETPYGTVQTRGGVIDLQLVEAPMSGKSIALAMGSGVAAAALFVAVWNGNATAKNAGGSADLSAGQRAALAEGERPRRVPNGAKVAALEAEIEDLRRLHRAEKAEVKRLKAQVSALKNEAVKAEGIELRPTAEVLTDLKALAKSEGLNIYGLSKDHPLYKELLAMGPEGINVLGELLKTGDSNGRFAAAALMERLGDPSAVPMLKEAFFSDDNEGNVLVQRMASHALAKIGGETAVPILESILTDSEEWGSHANAAYGLAEMGRKSGVDWLRENYKTQEDANAKMAILGAMAQVGDPSYLPDLHTVLTEETEYSKRFVAVTGIAKAARQESLPVREAIFNNPDEDKMIIDVARKAYDEIKGDD